ncbi:MAG: 6-pyruvoyl tetrahydropterin synthase family protein [Moraxellaceae bacterium]|jgi:6-pyruvoyltetrahydropterin/6-carboxytetrahydropterin synthase
MKIIRIEHFNAAHRLNNPAWSIEKNKQVFGKCNNDNFHGHNYQLEVHLEGPIDPETGYVMDMKLLSDIIRDEIIERFDHRNLNLDCPEFEGVNPSAENIARICWELLRDKIDASLQLTLRLWETPRNGVEYSGE